MGFYKLPNYQSFISQQGVALTLLAGVISLLSAFMSYSEKTEVLDWLLYDNSMKLSRLAPADDLLVIDIDDKSLSQIGRWPWPRQTHAQLLDILSAAQSKAVVFDILFPELDINDYASDVRFAQAIKRNGSVILPIYLETLGQQGQVIERPPHGLFYAEVKTLGHVHLHAEADGVIRSVFLKEGVDTPFWPHISLALVEHLSAQTLQVTEQFIPGSRAESSLENLPTVGIARDFHNLILMPSADQGLRHYSYSDILNGSVNLENLREKIVFIGSTAAGLGDLVTTPIGSMNGVELNAWIFLALRNKQLIQVLPRHQLAVISFMMVLVMVLLLGRLSPRLFLIFTLTSISGIIALSSTLLLIGGVWLPPASAILGIAVFFPLWSWLRAESILRFLRHEIEALSLANLQNRNLPKRVQSAQGFLQQIGMLDRITLQTTQKGERAIQSLSVASHQDLDRDFWETQLQKHTPQKHSLPHQYKGVEVIARTISHLSSIQENDRKNRQLIEKSLSRLQDAVCIADLCGEIIFTNTRFNEWFNTHEHPESLLDSLKQLELKSGMTWEHVFGSLFQTNKLFTDEAKYKTECDQQYLCQASLVSINETYNDTLILTFTDITQLKAAENARTEALSFLSHDLRSPMVSVLAILEKHHLEFANNGRPLSDDAIQHIESLVRKNLDYAESFLQLSKADALLESNLSPCDMHSVLDTAHVQARALAASKEINVHVERCDEDVWVFGDQALLERALNNLISNSVKFSAAGSLLTLRLVKLEQVALISVEDQGPGIAKSDQDIIFKRFTRVRKTETTEGAGLGLNFVATVAKKHHGRIELESELNHGSKFTLYLPLISEQELFNA